MKVRGHVPRTGLVGHDALRDPVGGLTQTRWFYANNVAFRRETFLSRQFPDVPWLKHVPAALLVERLEREGIAL